jgi:hypothetical protein
MHNWLVEAFIRVPRWMDPVLDAGRRHVMPVLRRSLPATRLAGRTAAGETARVLVVDRRLAAARLCRLLFAGEPEVEWSSRVPLTGLRGFIARERDAVDLVLANVPRALPAFLRPPGLVMPGLVEFLLPVLPDREAQYQLAHTKRRNRLRRCERAGYTSRIGHAREEIRHFIDAYHRPHVTDKFGDDAILQESFILERHARHGGVLWLLHEGRTVGGILFRQDGDLLWLMVSGMAANAPVSVPSPQEAVLLLTTDLARERNCRTVSFGAAAPVLRDGLFQFKASLGAALADYPQSHRELLVDWARPSVVLHALLRAHPAIVRCGRRFAALTSTVGVDPAAHLTETRKFVPGGVGSLLALEPGVETIETATELVAAEGQRLAR